MSYPVAQNRGMKINIYKEKLSQLAFRQFQKLQKLGHELFGLLKNPAQKPHRERLRRLIEWLTVPLTLWPIDFTGLGKFLSRCLDSGEEFDRRFLLLLDQLDYFPSQEEQDNVSGHEHVVQTGAYDSLLRNPAKYDAQEKELLKNEQLMRHWNQIKELFKVSKYRSNRGVIRRTQMQERNFRPPGWEFDSVADKEKWCFRAFFDLFCHRYNLYGMEYDRPLLQRPTINRTAYGTLIFIPRYLNFDPRHDLDWAAFHKIHWHPELKRQGPKASDNRVERNEMLRRIREANETALAEGKSGDERWSYIEDQAGLLPDTDRGTLRRLIRESAKLKGNKINQDG